MAQDKNGPKRKMSNRAFRALLIIPMVLVVLIAVVLNLAGGVASEALEPYMGMGDKTIVTPNGREDWDGNYYEQKYSSAEEAKEASYEVAAKVQDEGTVLLKNEGVLPLEKGSTVRPFGFAYLQPNYGQNTPGGSGKWVSDPVTPEEGLADFTIDPATVDAMKGAGDPVATIEAEGTLPAGDSGSMLGGDCRIYEFDPSIYDGVEANPDATGVVFISRSGQEGQDQKFDAYEDGTPHYLALSQNERGAIEAAKEKCGSVVVVLVTSAPMEMSDLVEGELAVDGIIWYGHPSERGFSRLSAILSGDVNPSGRTVDTWAADFTADPSYKALGTNTYTNLPVTSGSLTDGGEFNRTYNEYQEGVYMGYRYYETAAEVDPSFSYDDAVVFPFGYGLSYTSFSQSLDSVSEKDGEVTAIVTVTNTGDVPGKDVVQLYYGAPYTELDQQMQIEKPVCNLAAFDKTGLLAPGDSQTVELTFDMQDMASYSYLHENSDGTVGCYVLEAGDYEVSLRSNSHDVIDSKVVAQDETVWFDGSDAAHVRNSEKEAQSPLDAEGSPVVDESADFIAATNKFQELSDYMNTDSQILSRADWAGTQPVEQEDKEISEQFAENHDLFVTFDPETDPEFGNVEGSRVYAAEAPTSNVDNGLTLADLRGLDYDDPKWDELLDQIDWEADKDDIVRLFSGAAYLTTPVDSIGMPSTMEMDGVNGLKVGGGLGNLLSNGGYDMSKSSSFGFAPLLSSTWNKELLYEVGAAFGQESLAHGINGWYAPAINLHRSPFCGRVFEYYSEDPVLSGEAAAAVMSGAGDQGMFCYVKHFALNDTETGRADLICTWADEQTFRELYLRPFEIALEDSRMTVKYTSDDQGTVSKRVMRAGTAVMPAQNAIGTMVGECNAALLQDLLRDEWGFEGMAVSDYWVWNGDNLRDLAMRAGCDTYLSMSIPAIWGIEDYDSATARSAMRTAIHNIAYTVANSNAMQGVVPGSYVELGAHPVQTLLTTINVIVAVLVIGGIVLMVMRTRAERANPDAFKRSKRKQAKLDAKRAAANAAK